MLRNLILTSTWTLIRSQDESIGRRLLSFAQTEQGSALTLQLAAAQTTSARRQALYLRHAADEMRHARLFHEQGEALVGRRSPLLADGEDIYKMRGEIGFLAFVHFAERRGREQFELICNILSRGKSSDCASLLRNIAEEERHHERYSFELLVELCGDSNLAEREVRKIRRWDNFRTFRRLGIQLTNPVFSLVLAFLFPLFWLYGMVLRRAVPAERGFRQP
jgi:rubrerythrin